MSCISGPQLRLTSGMVLVFLLCGVGNAGATDGPSVLVNTTPAAVQTIAETLAVFGVVDVDPEYVQALSLPNGGFIDKIWINVGQRVSEGEELVRVIAAPDLRRQFEQARVELERVDQELARQKRLLNQRLSSNADVEKAQADRDNANATVVALNARGLASAESVLRSPVNGIITKLDVRQGDRVAPDTTALLIAPSEHLVARLGLEPENVGRISPGMSISLTPVFGSADAIDATINEVHGMIDPTTNLVEVLVDMPFDPMTVLGNRIIGQISVIARDAIVVPRSAVMGDDREHHVFIVQDGHARLVSVTTGIEAGNLIEVSGNIAVGQRVVVLGNYELEDGKTVRENRP